MLEEISCFDVRDEEYVTEDNGDEIGADMEVSDALVVEDVICEASQSIHLDAHHLFLQKLWCNHEAS